MTAIESRRYFLEKAPELKLRDAAVQSVDRAVSVLEYLSASGWSGVTEVASALGTHKSTAYRLLITLKDRGLVEQDAASDRYRLGLGLVSLASSVLADLDIVHYARPICERLRVQAGETVTISALAGNDVMVIYQAMSSSSVLSVNWRGKHVPLHCTSDGKVLLAHLSPVRRRAMLQQPLIRFTEQTVIDPELLASQLADIRRTGFGFTVEELETGLNAVAVPIFGADGSVAATIGLSGPSFRLPASSIPAVAERLQAGAREISSALGFSPAATARVRDSGVDHSK